ncbi:conserved oligomeric Golgi complex subunit 4, partial [Lingula anatina]|uniref:Conserved oligomeric Golgi complex subunit 4 n=1 Tax=Lingula anatina TaxID=7574 RepID=A0A1S3JEP3_LINAN
MAAPGGLGATSTMQLQNVHNLTNIEDMQKAFAQLCSEEESLNQELEDLQEHQTAIETKMLSLHKMLPNLQLLHTDSRQLSSMVSFTSTLAENVSGKVRQLDLAKSHVTACMQRVEDVLDLKFCTDGVQTALQNEDYEQAAAHIHRFLSLDENVLRMTEGSNEGSTLDTSFQLLHEAESKLKKIVHKNFDAAVHSKDVASVERFFKIFPLINLHDEGLTKFSKYLSAQISETAETNLNQALSVKSSDKRSTVIFADTITLLFEGIARVVEIHQPLVETYY